MYTQYCNGCLILHRGDGPVNSRNNTLRRWTTSKQN